MYLSLLNQKEKLKFLDLAIYMVDITGEPSEIEKVVLERMFQEVGYVVKDYSFNNSDPINITVDYFRNSNRVVKNIVFLNLVKLSLTDDLYNTAEHLFLERLQEIFDITPQRRRELMTVVYDERDLRERAARIIRE